MVNRPKPCCKSQQKKSKRALGRHDERHNQQRKRLPQSSTDASDWSDWDEDEDAA